MLQIGDESPDVSTGQLRAAFNTTQALLAEGRILAGHDISDGGIATTLLEMAFAGNCGIQVGGRGGAHAGSLAATSPWQHVFACCL